MTNFPNYELLDEYIPAVKKRMETRPYQVEATNHAWGSKRCVVDGKPGSGKTLIVWTSTLLQRPRRVLILCSKNALWTWKKELLKWFPEYAKHYVIVAGSPTQRGIIWSASKQAFFACTYGTALRDIDQILQLEWDVLICDEYQKAGLLKWKGRGKVKQRNGKEKQRETQGFLMMERLCARIRSVFPTSGTTTKKGPQHLWPILHLLNPRLFPSYWAFINRYCIVVKGPFGMEICGPQNMESMWATIKPHYHRIPRKESDKYMPAINRQIVPIDMDDKQEEMYRQVDDHMWIELEDGSIQTTSTVLAQVTKLRQILVCPKIVHPTRGNWGAGIDVVVDMLQEREDIHSVIFVPFRPAVPIFEDYLKAVLKTDYVYHVWGGTDEKELPKTVQAWKDNRGVMLCTTLYAQSFDLDTTDTCFFVGYECEHTDNEQCEGRLRRTSADITRPINAYYLQHRGTYDEHWLDLLVEKKRSVKITFDTIEQAREELKQARRKYA